MPAPVRLWGPVVLYMGLIFWSSSIPRPGALSETPDILLHGGAYFVLAVLSVRALEGGLSGPFTLPGLAGGIAIAVLYGLSDEWHQSRVPGRDGSLVDVLADAAGAVAAASVLWIWGSMRGEARE